MSEESRQDAVALLERVVRQDPASPLYLPLAERMREQGRVDDAIQLCEEHRVRPGRGVGDHIVLGRCYLAAGRLPEAGAEFRSALELDRENVAALKALAGIESHEGRDAVAADLYRAVCRIDPGDLESQTALHQITSGEFPEVRPPDLVLGQGEVVWQPVRLPKEEEHLSELALGLHTIDSFDADPPRATSPSVQDFRELSLESLEIELDAEAPLDRRAVETALAAVEGAPPAEGAQASVAPASAAPAPPSAAQPPAPASVAPAGVPAEAPAPPAARSEPAPAATGGARPAAPPVEPSAGPPAQAPRSEQAAPSEQAPPPEETPAERTPAPPRRIVEGNRSAFETWIRRLGSWESR